MRTLQSVHTALCTDNLRKNPTQDSTVSEDAGIEPRVGILEQSMGARNRVGIGLSYRSASLRSLTKLIPWK